MPTSEIEDLNAGMSEIVRAELARKGAKPNGHDPSAAEALTAGEGAPETKASDAVAPSAQHAQREAAAPRLPRRIPGGFDGLTADLDRRARDWRAIVRLMEQQRPQLEMAQAERDRLGETLARVANEVQETGRNLATMLATIRSGDVSGDLAAQFSRNVDALERLEDVTECMIANFILLRSSWEQYARSVIQAQGLRDELKPSVG